MISRSGVQAARRAGEFLTSARLFAIFPLLTILAYWVGGDAVLFTTSVLFPILIALKSGLEDHDRTAPTARDGLTGLYRAGGLVSRIDQMRGQDAKEMRSACIALDIDGFSRLKRQHGPQAADEILRRVGERLVTCIRGTDVIARLDGDRFAIALISDRGLDTDRILGVIERLQRVLAEPFEIGGAPVYLTICAGFAHLNPSPTGADLLSAAQTALEFAHQNGPASVREYTSDLDARSRSRRALTSEIGVAFDRGEIVAWYQPQICITDLSLSGLEALARWQHPDRGPIPPDQFLPLIDELGLHARLSETMMAQIARNLHAWDQAGLQVPQVGINLAKEDFANPRLVERLTWELDRFDLLPDRIAIEILESVIAGETSDIPLANITRMARMGFHIDLDDFGTGYSSITMLRRFPVGRIKIDRSFVSSLDRDPEQEKTVRAIMTMAKQLDVTVLAEGVETAGELARLSELSCAYAQGFYFARPMPAEETMKWLQRQAKKSGGGQGGASPVQTRA